jgi:hypothetical protein
MPPSPPTAVLTFSDKEQKEIQQQQQQQEEESFYNTGFYLPARNPARMVTAI